MEEIYQPSESDINQLIKQTVITEDRARELLIKNNGDIVQCILDNCNFKDNYSNSNNNSRINHSRTNNETQQMFAKMNNIVEEKNQQYLNMLKENQVNSNEIKII